eukprot:COSAG03_NODE_26314_length_260_cov_0.540373_2_plen_45_part_01
MKGAMLSAVVWMGAVTRLPAHESTERDRERQKRERERQTRARRK